MAMVPAIMVFGIMVWFATRDSDKLPHEEAQEEYDQRPNTYVPVYEIDGFNYCVYRISDPDGNERPAYEGQDKMFFIAEKSDNAEDAMANILTTAAGPATYQTLSQARSALDTLYDAMNPETGGGGGALGPQIGGPTYTSTDDEKGGTVVGTDAELPEGTIEAEGIEEGATMNELDVELYDGDGSLVESYNVADRVGTVNPPTNLGGSL